MKLALVLILPLLVACGDPKPMVCQHDVSDTVVDDSYCYDGIPGFEWDSGEPEPKFVFIPPLPQHSTTSKPKTTTTTTTSKPKPTTTVRKTF